MKKSVIVSLESEDMEQKALCKDRKGLFKKLWVLG